MTVEILLVFLVIIFALILFVTEKFPVDITALIILVTLMILGLNPLFPEAFPNVKEGLSGFSNEATVTVLAMFILSAGIQKTGIISILGRRLFGVVGNSEVRQLLGIGILIGPISGFINNTAAVAITLPMIIDLAKRSNRPATQLLIPLSFFGMLGGTLTLIGTSTNILAASLLKPTREIGMFDFLPLGILVFVTGFIYLLSFGRFLLPSRKNLSSDDDEKDDIFLTEIVIEKGSKLVGAKLPESKFEERNDIKVIKLIREKKSFIKSLDEKILEAGDILVIRASDQRIMDLVKKEGVKLLPNFDEEVRKRPGSAGKIVKVMLRGANAFHDRSLDEINFWKKYNAAVVGLQVPDITSQRLGSMKLRVGNILLIQASAASLQRLKYAKDFFVLETLEQEYNSEKMWMAIGIVLAVVFSATFLSVPIVLAALAGVLLMGLTRCISPDEMYDSVNWEIIILLAGIIPLGIAMQKSGAADFIAGGIIGIADILKYPIFLVAIFYIVTTLLTEIVSNNASVVLLVPIAISVANELKLDSFPLVLAVMFAASTSFLTPVGYQTNTMVYGSGNYRFSDFLRIGAPLNLILLFVTCFGIWLFYM